MNQTKYSRSLRNISKLQIQTINYKQLQRNINTNNNNFRQK